MAKSFSRNLQYFPAELSVWMQKAQLSSSEALGDLLKACLVSWSNAITGGTPGALPDDNAVLAQLIGTTNKKRLTQLRQSFTPSETPGVLTCGWLADLFSEKQESYRSASNRGRAGGRRGGGKPKAQLSQPGKPSLSRPLSESNSSGGGGTTYLLPPTERADAPPSGLGATAAPRELPDATAADAWIVSQPPEVLAELERAVDRGLLEEIPRRVKLAPDGPMFAAVRARRLDEAKVLAYRRSQLVTRECGPSSALDPPRMSVVA